MNEFKLPALGAGLLAALAAPALAQQGTRPFTRIATFPVHENLTIADETVAEIVSVSEDGNTLVYTDSASEALGFVDITNPTDPQPAGSLPLPGEPTSVAVAGDYALVCINTSAGFVNTSGDLVVVEIATQQVVATLPLGGQPDAIAVSPDRRFAAIAIENERDESLGNGAPPQLPAGYLVLVDLVGAPATWTTRQVDLTGLATLFPEDPEPEFVDINPFNVAVVTLQENNHIVLVDCASGAVLTHFSAGTVDLTDVDTNENDLIEQDSSLTGVPREPDAVAWTGNFTFATADEGDLDGGSRGFTTWAPWGLTLFEAGNSVEHATARIGHYPESRSENKGCEPEGAEYGQYAGGRYLFIGSERASVVLVYRLFGGGLFGAANPELVQILPTGIAPEGLLAIPNRDLFVVACEDDSRDDGFRASLMIYARDGQGNYPALASENRTGTDVPIPWAALSGLDASPTSDDTLYTIHDSYYGASRVYEIDRAAAANGGPARIVAEYPLVDSNMVLGNALRRTKFQLPGTDDFVIGELINQDGTVNLDPEGIAVAADGNTFWIASEGAGNLAGGVSDPSNRPFTSPNLIVEAVRNPQTQSLIITRVLGLPFDLVREQLRFGLEGITLGETGELFVCFQRAWQGAGDPADRARIGRFDFNTGRWTFAYYPLDAPSSPQGGWVGLSEITYLGGGILAVLERDNQANSDARVKRLYTVDANSVTFKEHPDTPTFETLSKTMKIDLLAAGAFDGFAGFVFEKLEGMAILSDGTAIIVNDNDGVDDNSGETRFIQLDRLFQ